LVTELDQSNPKAVCDPQVASTTTLLVEGGSTTTAPSVTTTYSYDTGQSYSGAHDYGNVTVTDTVANDGGSVGGSGNDLVTTTDYAVKDTVTTASGNVTATSAQGTYLVSAPMQMATHSGSATGPIKALSQTFYDGFTTLGTLGTAGDAWEQSVAYSGSGPYNFLTTTYAFDSYGNLIGIKTPNGQTGACTLTITIDGTPQAVGFGSCATYDTSSYTAHVTQVTNALGQHSTRSFGSGAAFGYGEWLQNATDANNQSTTYGYDALGRLTSITEPGEGTGLLTTQYVYSIWCPATGPSLPCSEQDTIQRYDGTPNGVVDSRTFFDGWGRIAEVRTPADTSNDVVHYTTYDAKGQAVFASRPYYVAAYTGGPGGTVSQNAYSAPDATQVGTSTIHDALGREMQSTDPAGAVMTTSFSQVSGPDGAVYQGVQVIDALHHKGLTLVDALGRHRYVQSFTGSSTYTLYSTTSFDYDFQGSLVTIHHPDGTHTTSFGYDLAGRKISETDSDQGTMTFVLDADGNLVQQTDARNQTFYIGYDALDRQLWRNTTNSPTGAYVTYTYDGTVPGGVSCSGITPGSNAIGHLTTEQFTSGPGNTFSGSYCYAYDQRGEKIGEVDTLAGTTYLPVLWTYNDAGVVTKLTYPTQEYEQYNYSAQERMISVTRFARGTTNYLIPSITYNGAAGASGQPDSYVVGGTGTCSQPNGSIVCVSLTYDNDLRLTHETFTHPSGTTITYYDMLRTFDAAGNVTSISSAMPNAGGVTGGQDNQQFCYDDLNRLTWAGNSGTNPCTNQAVTGTTIPNATYTASYQYDTSTRITQSTLTGALASQPQGSYTYDATHYHAVDAIGTSAYTAWYDAAGNMTCRTPSGPQVCNGTTQNGALLTYDVEGRLIQWVSADGATTVKFGYDGEGNRFELQVISGGTTTTTTSISNLEEIQVVGGTTTKTVYFYFNGQRVAEDQNTNWSYPLDDGLTSTTVMVNFAGVVAAQLFAPYGQVRWSGGSMPTSFAFTGHRADSSTGLDYYNARYYDPQAGQFTSADTVLPGGGYDPGGLDRFAYVEDNPVTRMDSNGHCWPFCTMIIGAVVGAVVSAATSVVTQVASGQGVNWGEVGKQAAVGAVAGAISGLAGPEAGPLVRGAIDGVASAAGQMVSNAIDGKPIMNGVLEAGVQGAASSIGMGALVKAGGALVKGAGKLIHGAEAGAEGESGAAAQALCNLSFSYDTEVATPSGEQAIGTLQVGDQVLAYDPQMKQISTQTVQHVWINHDNDLIDLHLQFDVSTVSDAPKPKVDPDGLPRGRAPPQKTTTQEETVHTTAKHPFLTAEQGWVKAGQLQPGMHVIRADGQVGVVEDIQVIPGAGTMYNLEVSQVHTFEVGIGRWVVHNCGSHQSLAKMGNEAAQYLWTRLRSTSQGYIDRTTIAFGFFQDANGDLSMAISSNNYKFTKFLGRLANKLGIPYVKGSAHAEANLLNYARKNNLELVALGTSRQACDGCTRMLQGFGYTGVPGIGPSGRLTTGFAYWWK
jgi:RHS repeat-associated protein